MEFIPYIIVGGMVVVDLGCILIFLKKRKALDLSTEEGKRKDLSCKTMIALMVFYIVVMAPLLLYFMIPVFSPIAN